MLMFDCGEGTQRQMMRYGTGFSLADIFFTHLHADHFLGVIGLLRTMGLQGWEAPVTLWMPRSGEAVLRQAVELGHDRIPFEVAYRPLAAGEVVERGDYEIRAFRTRHTGPSLGYALAEHPRLGRFDPERARQLGVPEGPLWGRLHRGETIEVDGRAISAASLVGEPRAGRVVVYTGDTRPCAATRQAATGADLLVHEATFGAADAERAVVTGHSTAKEAAKIARDAGAARLLLTHFSPRYAEDPRSLEREARKLFPGTVAAYDGLSVEIPYP